MTANELPADDWRRDVYGQSQITGQTTRRKPRAGDKARVTTAQRARCLYCDLPIGCKILRGSQKVQLRTNWDHFVPYAYLARNPDANWVLACNVCNSIKSGLYFETLQSARDAILPKRLAKGYEDPRRTLMRLSIPASSDMTWPVSLIGAAPSCADQPRTTRTRTTASNPRPAKARRRSRPSRPAGAASHSCGAWWTGTSRVHCPGCCLTFASERAALAHRPAGWCLSPEAAGLIGTPQQWGTCWKRSPTPR